jgi:hypothetical protein
MSIKVHIHNFMLTILSEAQGWQYKACPVPEHNAGPVTVRLAYFFLALTAFCVACRFVARWRIQNASIGWDDWSILISYIIWIPATVLIILSELSFVTDTQCSNHANFVLLVAKSGMGRDIWTVPADNITRMLKVRGLRSRHDSLHLSELKLTYEITDLLHHSILLPGRCFLD